MYTLPAVDKNDPSKSVHNHKHPLLRHPKLGELGAISVCSLRGLSVYLRMAQTARRSLLARDGVRTLSQNFCVRRRHERRESKRVSAAQTMRGPRVQTPRPLQCARSSVSVASQSFAGLSCSAKMWERIS